MMTALCKARPGETGLVRNMSAAIWRSWQQLRGTPSAAKGGWCHNRWEVQRCTTREPQHAQQQHPPPCTHFLTQTPQTGPHGRLSDPLPRLRLVNCM